MYRKRKARFFSMYRRARTGAELALLGALLYAAPALGQIAPPAAQTQTTQAVQLPLSGRTAQTNGTVKTSEVPAPSTTATVNTLNPNVQVQGAYAGSTPSVAKMPFNGRLGLREAIQRGLAYNLGQTGATEALRQAQGQNKVALSYLLPNLNGTMNENVQTTDLRAEGFRFAFKGFTIPTVIGPFNYIDMRAHLSQSVLDLTAINNYRSAKDVVNANRYSGQDARGGHGRNCRRSGGVASAGSRAGHDRRSSLFNGESGDAFRIGTPADSQK